MAIAKINDIHNALKKIKIIKHICQHGTKFDFKIYGIKANLFIKGDYYYSGIHLINQQVTELSWETISELTLVLSGGKDIPDHNLYVSDENELYVFSYDSTDMFLSDQWFDNFKKLLALRSCVLNMIISHEKPINVKRYDRIDKNWIYV